MDASRDRADDGESSVIVMPADNTGIRVGYLAGRFPGKVGHLHSPRPGRSPAGPFEFLPYALDNGAFAAGDKWDESLWIKMLDWARMNAQQPIWALVPDVVGDRIGTLRKWDTYAPRAARYGWPLAFAVQDGMLPGDVPPDAQVVFVGGSTEWKWRNAAMWCKVFRRVHIGRVNTYRRLWECHNAGAESCDGTGWFRGWHGDPQGLLRYLEETAGCRTKQIQMELIA